VDLSPEERQELERWQRMTTRDLGTVRRGRIILLRAAGLSMSDIARTAGISRRFVYKWVQRFQVQRVAGLQDRPRLGRPGRRAGSQGRLPAGG
jgi:transposase